MKKFFCFAILALFASGCTVERAKPAEKMYSHNGWHVELCFEKDGYKVYRFSDGPEEWRYYVVPDGEMIDHTTTTDEDGVPHYHVKNTRTVK